MKSTLKFAYLLLFSSLFAACSNGSAGKSEFDSLLIESEPTKEVLSMSEYNNQGTVEVNGTKYDYEFNFRNDKSLPVVTTEEGYRYHDNYVSLVLMRGQEIIGEKRFTKASFKELIPAKDYERSVLAGFNFNYMQAEKHDNFYFIAAVGDPDETSSINYSIGITISRQGNVSTSIIANVDTEPIHDGLNAGAEDYGV